MTATTATFSDQPESQWSEFKRRAATPTYQRVIKLSLAIVSALALGLILSWTIAIHVMVALAIHEQGHVLAMKWTGVGAKGVYFVPLLGAVAIANKAESTRKDQFWIAIGGPIVGGATVPIAIFLLWLTKWEPFALYAIVALFVNLFNLLPLMPLDGGRVMWSVLSSWGRWATNVYFCFTCFVVGVSVILTQDNWYTPSFVTIIFIIGALQIRGISNDEDSAVSRRDWLAERIDYWSAELVEAQAEQKRWNNRWYRKRSDSYDPYVSSITFYQAQIDSYEQRIIELEKSNALPAEPMSGRAAVAALALYIGTIFLIVSPFVFLALIS